MQRKRLVKVRNKRTLNVILVVVVMIYCHSQDEASVIKNELVQLAIELNVEADKKEELKEAFQVLVNSSNS